MVSINNHFATENNQLQAPLADAALASLLDHLPDALLHISHDGQILYANQMAVERLMPTGELEGMKIEQLAAQSPLVQGMLNSVTAVMHTGCRLEGMARDKTERYVQFQIVPAATANPAVIVLLHEVTHHVRTEQQLQQAHQQLQSMTQTLQIRMEHERKHLAREIHDELGQHLSSLRIRLALMAARPTLDLAAVNTLIDQVDNTIQVVRNVSTQLRPAVLNMGLIPALRWLVEEFNQHPGASCQLKSPISALPLGDCETTSLFRVVQESLTNIRRHAGASQCWVLVNWQAPRLRIRVQDDGAGFVPDPLHTGCGLPNMRERCLMHGWAFSFTSTPGEGTSVEVDLRVNGTAPDDAAST